MRKDRGVVVKVQTPAADDAHRRTRSASATTVIVQFDDRSLPNRVLTLPKHIISGDMWYVLEPGA